MTGLYLWPCLLCSSVFNKSTFSYAWKTSTKMTKHENRAERLGALLASRNALVRHEAAQALGHFPLTNPQIALVLRNNFQANAWDTREAAVEAFRAILKAMPLKNKIVVPRTESVSQLNLNDVVHSYHPLLSCEADMITEVGVFNFGEQHKLVDEQLEFQTAVGVTSETFLSEEDFSLHEGVRCTALDGKLNLARTNEVVSSDENMEELDRVLHSFCIKLMHDVVDMKWEIRHGAALAIACVLSTVPSRLSSSLLDILATRLLQAVALDTFIDFSSGRTAIGPVREAVAECIARLMVAYPSLEFTDAIFKHIYALHAMADSTEAEWHTGIRLGPHMRVGS